MVAYELADRMHREGHYVKTACTLGSPLADRLIQRGLPILPVRRRNKYLSPSVIQTLRNELTRNTYSSILIEQLNELWQVIPAIRGKSELKVVGISHTLVGTTKHDILHRRLYSRLDHLIALTSIHKRNLVENLPIDPGKISILPNAVDLRRFRPSQRSEQFRAEFVCDPEAILIGAVSRIDAGKGLRELLEATAQIKPLTSNFKLIVVGRETIGEEGMMKILADDIKRLELHDHVVLTGHRQDIETVMASLDFLVMPSPRETFGRVLIEAMASGTPVVASAGGGVPDIVESEREGLLFEPLDVPAMALAMTRLIGDAKLRQKLANAGLCAAKERYDQHLLDQQLFSYLGLDKSSLA